jgi:hypothetical protein
MAGRRNESCRKYTVSTKSRHGNSLTRAWASSFSVPPDPGLAAGRCLAGEDCGGR